jgi:riboflavin synthase
MFTGIITDVGTITKAEQRGDLRLIIQCGYDMSGVDLGASIACSGVCLTVVDKGADWFAIDASAETASKTSNAMWAQGRRLNLERALKIGDELGGHIVTGHVDGVGTVATIAPEGDSHRVSVTVGAEIAPYIATKGSVTVDGVSLTVNSVVDNADGTATFGLNIIPHTWDVTALGDLAEGQQVNVEIDVLARYLARMQERLSAAR